MRLRQALITYKHHCIKSRLCWPLRSTTQILYSEIYVTDKVFSVICILKTETGSYLSSFSFLKAARLIERAHQLSLNYFSSQLSNCMSISIMLTTAEKDALAFTEFFAPLWIWILHQIFMIFPTLVFAALGYLRFTDFMGCLITYNSYPDSV